jgi:hypothetical protein
MLEDPGLQIYNIHGFHCFFNWTSIEYTLLKLSYAIASVQFYGMRQTMELPLAYTSGYNTTVSHLHLSFLLFLSLIHFPSILKPAPSICGPINRVLL